MRKEGDYLVFPGGGTQFKDGVGNYIDFIEQVSDSCLLLFFTTESFNLSSVISRQKDIFVASLIPLSLT